MCVSTGNQGLDIALAIGIGAATGGMATPAMSVGLGAQTVGMFSATTAFGMSSAALGAIGGGIMGGVGSMAMSALMPQQPAEYPYPQYEQEPTYYSQQNQITGSGGAQAPAYLAKEMKRIKTAKNKEQPRATSSINTETFSGTGLQIA